MPEHRRGTEKSAEDLVGPPEWMESERRTMVKPLEKSIKFWDGHELLRLVEL